MDNKTYLQKLGLEGKKADVYLAALEMGSATVIQIARKAGIKRTTCYDILLDLINSGLISETAKGKKRLFIGENPEKIKRDLQIKEGLIKEVLPQLLSIYNIKGVKPKIRFYEGREGLKEVYADTIRYSAECVAFASEDVVEVLGKDWAEWWLKQRVKRGVQVRAIFPKTELIKEYTRRDQEQLRQSKLIDAKKYPFSVEIDIYGHQKVALISCKELMAVIIEGAEIHKTMKAIFDLAWDSLPEIKL